MEIVRYWKAVKRRLWIIVLLGIISVAAALWQDSVRPPLYSATTLTVLNPYVPAGQLPFWDPELTMRNLSETYSYWLRTRAFGSLVSRAMGGEVSADEVINSISARQVGGTRFFEITAVAGTPERAQQLANVSSAVFVAENPQQMEKPSEETVRLLQAQLQFFQEREQTYQAKLEDLISQRPVTEDLEREIDKAETKLMTYRDYVIKVLTSLGQLGVTEVTGGTRGKDSAFILDPARLPSRPLYAPSSQNIIFALAAALALGIGVSLLLEYLDLAVTIRTPEELETALGLPTLGVVGVISSAERPEKALVTVDHPRSPNAEAFRAVHTNIKLSRTGATVRSILVTSAGPSEGKTITATNLAVAIAESGERIALIDADLRRPGVHKYFGLSNTTGLSNLLVDDMADVAEQLIPTGVENLWIVPSGPIPPRPSVLLSLPRMDEVLHQILERCDMVVLDSPPVMAVTDAAVMASRVDAVLLVVMAGRTSRDLLSRSKDTLANVGSQMIGSVLNRVRSADLGAYYLYHYYRYAQQKPKKGSQALHVGGEKPPTRAFQ